MSLRRRRSHGDDVDEGVEEGWFADPYEDVDDELDERSRRGLPASLRLVVAVVAVLAVIGLGVLAAAVTRESPRDAAPPIDPAATSSSTAPPMEAATTVPATASPPTAAAITQPAQRSAVTTLQTVPAIRDLVVVVGDNRYSTAADGTIVLAPNDVDGTVTVLGVHAEPALLDATFTGWADGNQAPTRSLAELAGPVVQLGFTVSYRVQVVAGIATDGAIAFESDAGPATLTIGVPTFVPAMRTTTRGGVLAAEPITYTAQELRRGAAEAPIPAATFVAAPEARWQVTI